jgi:hypothetical protein
MEFDDFDEIPSIFNKSCSAVSQSATNRQICNNVFGWRVDEGMIDSGVGLPAGSRLILSADIDIEDDNGGLAYIEFYTLNLTDSEYFKVLINGAVIYSTNETTDGGEPSTVQFDLAYGKYTIDITLESDVVTSVSYSKAQVLISKIHFEGLN